jgi:hypothetical protein
MQAVDWAIFGGFLFLFLLASNPGAWKTSKPVNRRVCGCFYCK